MTTPTGPILDYAAPATKSRFRFAKRSVLRMQQNESTLTIVEQFEDHRQAITAIVFAMISLAIMTAVGAPLLRDWREMACFLCPMGIVFLSTFVTTIAVIDTNWQRTLLEMSAQRIALRFWSPIRGKRRHEWDAEQLRSATIEQVSADPRDRSGVLQLDFAGEALVNLFAGHRWDELKDVEQAIHKMFWPAPGGDWSSKTG